MFNFVFKINFEGMNSSSGKGLSVRKKVSLSNNSPVISDLMSFPHLYLLWGDKCNIWLSEDGPGIKSD